MVIMARARQNRKQWRPKAAIESAAAQHRTNANHLLTTFLQDKQNETIQLPTTTSTNLNECPLITNNNESSPLTNNPTDRNVLMLQLSTPVLSPALRASINITSSSGEQLDDDERDDIALFVHHEQQANNKLAHENQIEILPSTITSNMKSENSKKSHTRSTTTRSSQTDNHHDSHHYSAKRFKTRLKTKSDSDGLTITTSTTQGNNTTKIAKRKAYSRMKKERKATQTLIIVLSMI